MARILGKWKNTGKYAWHEDTSEYKFRVSPKFKTSKQAENYAKKEGIGWHSYFTVRDKPTSDECKADKLDPYGHYTQKNGGVPSTAQMRNRSDYNVHGKDGVWLWEHLSPDYRKRAEALDKEQTKFWDGQLERESPDGKISSFEKMKKKDARRKLMAPSNREYRFDIDGKAGEDSLVASYGKGRELTIIKTADGDIMTQEKY
tara:strand:- start:263 stop:868 length:606 start_codon:yes stop_codon:yes gene_type:complete